MHTLFNNKVVSLLTLFASFFLISADLHFNTSASMRYKDIKIRYLDSTITANLNSPGVKYQKYESGRLKRLTIHKINSVIELYFHDVETGPERVAMIQNFRVYNGLLLLDGSVQRLSIEGNLESESNWHKGYLQGKQIVFNDDQKLIEEKWYDKGVPVKAWNLFYSNGQLASSIRFPGTAQEWEDTLISNKGFDKPTTDIYAIPNFQHWVKAKEVWYTPSGKKSRETVYNIAKTPKSYKVKLSGEYQIFGKKDQLVGEEKLYRDSGIEQHMFTSLGRTYHKRNTWLNERLFKSQDYIILSEEELLDE
ncbi:MAG: hypothetical protein GWP59_05075 [Chlamydiales bacterium]|nr:hypothetical protein [Chlamydiales bacterium]